MFTRVHARATRILAACAIVLTACAIAAGVPGTAARTSTAPAPTPPHTPAPAPAPAPTHTPPHTPTRAPAPAPAPAPATGPNAPVNHVVNDRTDDPPGRVQSEVALAVHGATVVIVWNDAIGYYEDASMCGYGVSLDGGATWRDGGELPRGAAMRIAGDPWITSTETGELVVSSVDTGNDDGIAVHTGRVSNGELVWETPSTYIRGGGEALDKPAIAYDPTTGALYLAYVNWSQNRGELARSNDRGRTWQEPLVVFESSRATGYTPVLGVDGDVYVTWVDHVGEPGSVLYTRRSGDGGGLWAGPPARLATLGAHAHEPPLGYDRTVNATFPSVAVDRSPGATRGRLIATWTDGEPGAFEVLASVSDDHGETWRRTRRVRDEDATGDAFWPRVRVGREGRVVVGWYDRRHGGKDGSATAYTITSSLDGGITFGPDHALSDRAVPWLGVPSDFTPNFGDYTDLVLDDHAVYAAWSDARAGDPDVVFSRRLDRVPIIARILVDGATRTHRGAVWTLMNETSVPMTPARTDARSAIGALPLVLLASADGSPGLLAPVGGTASGSFAAYAGDVAIATAGFSLRAPDQHRAFAPDSVELVLNVHVPEATLDAAGGDPGAWESIVSMVETSNRTWTASGTIQLSGAVLSLTGTIRIDDHETRARTASDDPSRPSRRLTPRTRSGVGPPRGAGATRYGASAHVTADARRVITQSGWFEAGNLRTRARVHSTVAVPRPAVHGTPHATQAAPHATPTAMPPVVPPATARIEPGAPTDRVALRVIPHPVSRGSQVLIVGPGATDAAVHLYDVSGRRCRTLVASVGGDGRQSIRLDPNVSPALAPGVYIARVESRDGDVLASAKVVIGP